MLAQPTDVPQTVRGPLDLDEDGLSASDNKRILIETDTARISRGDLPPFGKSGTMGDLYTLAGEVEKPSVSDKRSSLTLRINLRALNPDSPHAAITIKGAETLVFGNMYSAKLRDLDSTTIKNAVGKDIASAEDFEGTRGESYIGMIKQITAWLETNLPGDTYTHTRSQIIANIAQFIIITAREGVFTDGDKAIQNGKLVQLVNNLHQLSPTAQERGGRQ